MTMRYLVLGLFAVFMFHAVAAEPAWACSCVGVSTFEAISGKPGVDLLVGRDVAVTDSIFPRDPKFVDVDVTSRGKQAIAMTRMRVWNIWAGTSCGGALSDLAPGDQVAVAARVAASARLETPDFWEMMEALGFRVPPSDHVITATCGPAVRVLRTREDLDKYVGRSASQPARSAVPR